MALELPEPDATRLPRSPLALVVCQIGFEEVPAVADPSVMLAVYEQLGGREGPYAQANKTTNQTVNVHFLEGALQPLGAQAQTGWRFASEEGAWTVALMPDHVSLQTTAYTTWQDDFRGRLHDLLKAVGLHVRPALEQRVGLRYVNRIVEPAVKAPAEWHGYIADELLGPILHGQLASAITACQQQIDVDLGGDARSSIRHGFFPDPSRDSSPTYLLDIDVYRQGLRPFDADDIGEAADNFNRVVLQLFQAAVTPRLLKLLRTEHVRS